MSPGIARIRGIGYLIWHTKHELMHILLGLVWAWILREWWGEFNTKWILWAIFGSLLPDIDHVLYWIVYGKKDVYSRQVLSLLKQRQWRSVFLFVETSHKQVTGLISHNYYVAAAMLLFSCVAWVFDWEIGVILCGAMVTHYLFDILDDLIMLGYVNPNWKRLGRPRSDQQGSTESHYESS